MKKILIVEDEKNLGLTLKEFLSSEGHNCSWAQTGEEAITLFKSQYPQVVLMDIGLPDTNGIELSKRLRELDNNFILLFLSAQNDPETKVKALESSGMDYITKPFALKELMLRLDRIFKFLNISKDNYNIKIGKLTILFKEFEVIDAYENTIRLTTKECSILKLLYEHRGKVVAREEILDQVWGPNTYPSNRTVDNYIVSLRKWYETDSNGPLRIDSIRGVGYKLIINNIEN